MPAPLQIHHQSSSSLIRLLQSQLTFQTHHHFLYTNVRFSLVAALAALASTAYAAHEACFLVEPKGDFAKFTITLHAKNDPYLMHQSSEESTKTSGPYVFANTRGQISINKDLQSFTANFGTNWGTTYFQESKWLVKNKKYLLWACVAGQEAPEYCADAARKWAGCQKAYP
ncbi:hypothetical protein B0O80DRAFT_500737 [Mortierella sp. GBAus27b]|nr:hypothetical protein BGX31_008529 [Mortierella sp. GBA43]KAI8350547.1 hypothetical protein B0O80DRAFT_500737 [Mortierella sp. GBAus27b]